MTRASPQGRRAEDLPCGGDWRDRSAEERDAAVRNGREGGVRAATSPTGECSGSRRGGIPAVAGAGAYYILHLRESTPGSGGNGSQRCLAGDFL